MKAKQINKSKGFTIIETLIVLAIAATIFLVVFLAVNSLNRSSRNTQRKDDASAILAGATTYVANNSGQLPTTTTGAAPTLQLTNAAGTGVNESVKLAHFTTIGFLTVATIPAATDQVDIIPAASCNGGTAVAGSIGSFVVIWGVETGSNTYSWNCIGS